MPCGPARPVQPFEDSPHSRHPRRVSLSDQRAATTVAQDLSRPTVAQLTSKARRKDGFRQPHALQPLGMDELIRYQVRVGSRSEPSFEIREPRSLRDGDRFNWQGRSYQVVTVRFHPDHPRQAVATVKRADARN